MLLSIDQGTTSTRAVVYDPAGFRVLGSAQREIRQFYPQPGWVEHDADEIWASVAEVVSGALARARVDGKQLSAIGITNQRETIVLWDRKTGQPVARAIVWQDRRTTDFCREHAADEPWLNQKTGLVLDPYFSATKLKWMLDSDAWLRAAADRGEIACGTMDSFLLWRLTRGVVHATDVTNASRTLLFDIAKFDWDEELLRYFGIPRAILPCHQPSMSEFGTTKGLGFLPDGIRIAGIAGDQQAALFGQGAFNAGQAKCTYGTGAFILQHTGTELVRSRHRLLTTVAAGKAGERNYALEGSVFVAGAAVQWLRDGLTLFADSAETESLAAQSNSAEPILFVPAFVGLGSPYWVPEVRGAIFGLTRSTEKKDVARAALEGVAFQVADLVDAAKKDTGAPLAALRVDGGMSRNDWFLQRQADVLGVPILKATHDESTALGAAMLAGVTVGVCGMEQHVRGEFGEPRRFEPTWSDADRAAKLERWRRAIRAVIALEREEPL
jgi:glycerol kinase